ncbi:glycosyltransferase, partial [Mycobacterium tuberculosis]|nr:glycosyltransferase [Mycobacterium tuberculosis]
MIPDRAESGELDVSVIIPVYNVEDYLPECLDSLVNQALGSFTAEVIAVDDG